MSKYQMMANAMAGDTPADVENPLAAELAEQHETVLARINEIFKESHLPESNVSPGKGFSEERTGRTMWDAASATDDEAATGEAYVLHTVKFDLRGDIAGQISSGLNDLAKRLQKASKLVKQIGSDVTE